MQLKAAQTSNPLQARRNESESERTRLLWADTPSPPPPAKSWNFKQSNPVNRDTERGIESVRIYNLFDQSTRSETQQTVRKNGVSI